MIWISLVLLLSFIIVLVLWKFTAVVLSKFPSLMIEDSVIDLIIDYWKVFLLTVVVGFLVGLYSVSYQVHEMYTCSVRGTVQKVDTQYTWYFDKCQFKNKNGVYVDFDKVRGTPGEEDDGSTS